MAKDRKIDVVILGLLSHEDLTGYDIKKRLDGAIGFFWKGSFGNIYPALTAMEKEGLVSKKKNSKTGGREKIPYHITKQGIKALQAWLQEEQTSNELRYETLLKLYFGGAADRSLAIRNIQIFEEDVKCNLTVLNMYKDNLEKVLDEEDHIFYYLTVTFGIDTYEAYLKWCAKAKKLLRDG
ncbi:Virulence activator alpha C-term [Butyrivibrio sp. ob235]|uniref:PadR family transcriptional regulator n=1 Tax=Butyrivibrio sp. ob235 TaxID=1761780 RepID=UPI0008AB2F74|nr:PadR family transcriptional regulator [Butyrivibrio sp. ob235]SEM36080.1 Virulence activator alpha C-term [Butyrivibrio sp. ob235]